MHSELSASLLSPVSELFGRVPTGKGEVYVTSNLDTGLYGTIVLS